MDVRVLRTGLIISVIALILASIFKDMNWKYSDIIVKVSVATTVIFLLLVIVDIIRNGSGRMTKTLWIAAILIPVLILFYFLLKLAILLVFMIGAFYLYRRVKKRK